MTIDNSSDQAASPAGGFLFAVDALREIQVAMAGLAAMEMSLYSAVFEHAEQMTGELPMPIVEREMALRTAAAEIGAALRMSDRAVQSRMSHAWDVSHSFPQVFEALRVGRITPSHVQAIVRGSDGLPAGEEREAYEVAALERAEVTTPARLATILPAVAQQIHATSITERHQRARRERRVEVRDTADGMSELTAILPAVLAHGIFDRLTSMAKSVAKSDPEDPRSRDEVRADVLADLALGGGPIAAGDGLAAICAQVQVSVPVLTAAGVQDEGAQLLGVGPMDSATARRLVGASSGWDRVMTDPVTGGILAVDRYRPNADLRRSIRVRDEHCRFPGCRQQAHRCDGDHSEAAADGGATCIDNLALLCRGHHVLKHAAKWIITHLSHGVLQWTSPSGRNYVDTPTRTLRFVPSGPASDLPSGPASDPPADVTSKPSEPGPLALAGKPDASALAGKTDARAVAGRSDAPDPPDDPDAPDMPDAPGKPDALEKPDALDALVEVEKPDAPGKPDVLDALAEAEKPDAPEKPDALDALAEGEKPGAPDVPDAHSSRKKSKREGRSGRGRSSSPRPPISEARRAALMKRFAPPLDPGATFPF